MKSLNYLLLGLSIFFIQLFLKRNNRFGLRSNNWRVRRHERLWLCRKGNLGRVCDDLENSSESIQRMGQPLYEGFRWIGRYEFQVSHSRCLIIAEKLQLLKIKMLSEILLKLWRERKPEVIEGSLRHRALPLRKHFISTKSQGSQAHKCSCLWS